MDKLEFSIIPGWLIHDLKLMLWLHGSLAVPGVLGLMSKHLPMDSRSDKENGALRLVPRSHRRMLQHEKCEACPQFTRHWGIVWVRCSMPQMGGVHKKKKTGLKTEQNGISLERMGIELYRFTFQYLKWTSIFSSRSSPAWDRAWTLSACWSPWGHVQPLAAGWMQHHTDTFFASCNRLCWNKSAANHAGSGLSMTEKYMRHMRPKRKLSLTFLSIGIGP